MKRIFLTVMTLGLASQTMAVATVQLTSQATQFIASNNLDQSVPFPLFDVQKSGLNWLTRDMDNGEPQCPPLPNHKHHTVGRISMECSGNELQDVTQYFGLVKAANFKYCVGPGLNDPDCP